MNVVAIIGAISGALALYFFAKMVRCLRRKHIIRAGRLLSELLYLSGFVRGLCHSPVEPLQLRAAGG